MLSVPFSHHPLQVPPTTRALPLVKAKSSAGVPALAGPKRDVPLKSLFQKDLPPTLVPPRAIGAIEARVKSYLSKLGNGVDLVPVKLEQ